VELPHERLRKFQAAQAARNAEASLFETFEGASPNLYMEHPKMYAKSIVGLAIITSVFYALGGAVASSSAATKSATRPKNAAKFNWRTQFSEILAEDPTVQGELCRQLAADMPASQVPEAIDTLNLSTNQVAKVLEIDLAMRWGQDYPERVATWARAHLPDDVNSQHLYFYIVMFWAQKDFPTARAWVEGMPHGGSKAAATLALATQAANQSRGKLAVTLAEGLPPGADRDNLISYCVQKWARTDCGDAVTWTRGLQNKAQSQKIINSVVCDISVTDPRQGLKIAINDMAAGIEQDIAVDQAVRFWAAADPKSAAAWARALKIGHLSNVAVAALPVSAMNTSVTK